jgi:predicted O-methyltransferase YrrM
LWRILGRPEWVFSGLRDLFLDKSSRYRRTEFTQIYRTVRSSSLTGYVRLRALHQAVQHVIAHDIPGDFVECGTARGGSAALMGLTLEGLGADRSVWLFDTFEGLPPPTLADPDWRVAQSHTGTARGTIDEVSELLSRLGILERYKLIKGLFEQTLSQHEVQNIAVLHLDCDWYESMRCCLERLYDRVSPGGVIQIDDYGHWQGARKAVDEFLRERSIVVRLRWIDYTGRQLIKPGRA